MNSKKEMMVAYEAPQVEIVEVEVEKGFTASLPPLYEEPLS